MGALGLDGGRGSEGNRTRPLEWGFCGKEAVSRRQRFRTDWPVRATSEAQGRKVASSCPG